MNRKQISTALALIIAGSLTILAQTPGFNNVKPSTTGVPGEEVRVMKLDPAGNLWIAGRFYFWEEVGLAMLSADQLDHQPLPGGGFATGAWKVWSSVHHPIPSVFINDIAFGAGGKRRWVDSIRPRGTNRRADVVHLYAGQLAVDHE